MDFLGFTLSVWAAIGIGVFFLALVIACTADRYDHPKSKWVVLLFGLLAFVLWQWSDLSWAAFTSASLWKGVSLYVAIGLAYSIIEFLFQVRRESRYWKKRWEDYKPNYKPSQRYPEQTMEEAFLEQRGHGHKLYSDALIKMTVSPDKKLVPEIDRGTLAGNVTCWTLFWPAYAVSLALGDLLAEIFKRFAHVLAALSSGVVRRMFSKTFNP